MKYFSSYSRFNRGKRYQVRTVRNKYLEQTDKFMIADYPITDDERELYKQYRTYLRDYTLSENWWEHSPMTFEEWNVPAESKTETEIEGGE